MSSNYTTKESKDSIIKNFLIIPKEFKKYNNSDIIWIYKLTNTENNKIYIGKTNNLRQRAFNYINDFLKGELGRKISKAICDIGIDKFTMIPLEVACTEKSAEIKEMYYIDLYDTITNGYNSVNASTTHSITKPRKGVPHTLYSKMIKSKLICCINDSENKIIFSTGLKLFGDYIGRHKDEIKSAARRETRLDGYFIYYLNNSDFRNQIANAQNKIFKNIKYDDNILQYHSFIAFAKIVQKMVLSSKYKYMNYDILFITQSNDECGYCYKDITEFDEYYSSFDKKITKSEI